MEDRMAVMLNPILQFESHGEGRESATEAVLMAGYTSDGKSNEEQTKLLSWSTDGRLRPFNSKRNPDLRLLDVP